MLSILALVLLCCGLSASAFPNPFKKIKEKFNDIQNEIKNEFGALKSTANREISIENVDSSTPILSEELHLYDKPVGEAGSTMVENVAHGIESEIRADKTNGDSDIDQVVSSVQTDYVNIEEGDASDGAHDDGSSEIVTSMTNTESISVIIDSSTIDLDSMITQFATNESLQVFDGSESIYELELARQNIDDELLWQENVETMQRQEAEVERLRREAYYGNWSSFAVLTCVDATLSNDIIRSLKFSSYFDKSIGEFKVGILGVDMASVLPSDLIITVEKSMNRMFFNVSSVDVTSLLSHSLASSQYIAATIIPLRIHPQLDELNEKPVVFHQVESKFAALRSNPNSFLSKELRISRGIIEHKLHRIEMHIIKQRELTKHKVALEAYKCQRNFELLHKQHEYLISLMDRSSKNISSSITANHKQRFETLLISNEHVLNESTLTLKVQLEVNKAMLQHKINISIEILKYQAIQAQQYVIDNELNNNILLEIMNNNTRDSTQKVIETVFNDVTSMLHEAILENPTGFMFKNMHVVAIVFGVIILVEIVGFVPIYLVHRKNLNILLKSNQRTVKNEFKLSELVLTTTMTTDLKTYMDNVGIGLRYACAALPNLLIIGSSGTGKSVLAHAIAEQLQASYVSICEADLEPLGMNAGFYLRNLFQSKYGESLLGRMKKPFFIIIDGADLLVKPRKPKFISKASNSVSPRGTPHAIDEFKGPDTDDRVCSNCLYTLLSEMKVASPNLSLIVTTNRSVAAIDSAILNRTDSILVLTTPLQLQRLRYILYNLPIQVGQFLDDTSFKILSDASLVGYLCSMNTQGTEITNQLIQSILNNIKKQRNNEPETDRPASLKIVTALVAAPSSFDTYSNTTFDLENCISNFVVMTEGWSFRELEKFLLSLRQEILSMSYVGQDSKLVLTSMVFMKTLYLVGNRNNSDI